MDLDYEQVRAGGGGVGQQEQVGEGGGGMRGAARGMSGELVLCEVEKVGVGGGVGLDGEQV